MTSPGFSQPGLRRLHDAMARHVEREAVAGIVTALQRDGEPVYDAIGVQDLDTGVPMSPRTIFQLWSMTKPFTVAATLHLIEEGRFGLADDVATWLPELASPRVLRTIGSDPGDTVPANRPITVHHLLASQLGTGVVLAEPGTYPIQAAQDAAMAGAGPAGSDAWLRALAALPLIHQPGEGWLYNTSYDVLGIVLERATGQPLGDVIRERVTGPLGMADTGYVVSEAALPRLATAYHNDPATGALVADEPDGKDWTAPPAHHSGAHDMVSTGPDLLRFGRMLLGMGTLDGVRILSPQSVRAMTADHVPPAVKASTDGYAAFLGRDGWGYGVQVVNEPDRWSRSAGSYGWIGGLNTHWHNDPAQGLVGVLLFQRHFTSFDDTGVRREFWPLVYEALER